MKTNPKFIFFTDFDGTITTRDSNDFLTDNLGFGQKLRKQGNQDVLDGRKPFRDSFQEMMDSIKTPYDRCIQTLVENVGLDPYFKDFFYWAKENNVPILVMSGGMRPIIEALLLHLVGTEAEDIDIVSNDVAARDGKSLNEEGGWKIMFHDDRQVALVPEEILKHLLTWIATLAMINQLRFGNTPIYPTKHGRQCSMLEMESRTCLLRKRRICCLRRKDMV